MTGSHQLSLLSPSVASPVKWVGSKAWLAPKLGPELLSLLQRSRNHQYHELCAGGASLFFALRQAGWSGLGSLSDACLPLIGLYRALRADAGAVYAALQPLLAREASEDQATLYYELRDAFNLRAGADDAPSRAALFLWLNHRGFNGLYRENQAGQYNASYGGERSSIPSLSELQAAGHALQNTVLYDDGFAGSGMIHRVYRAGDVVFADPPYDGTFTGYVGGFSDAAQEQLASLLERLAAQGVRVFATNSDTPRIRQLYRWARVEELTTRYVVGGDRELTTELLLRGGV